MLGVIQWIHQSPFPNAATCPLTDPLLFSSCRGRSRVLNSVRPSWPLPGGEFVQAQPCLPGMWLDAQPGGPRVGWGWPGEEGQQLDNPGVCLLDPPGKLKGHMPALGLAQKQPAQPPACTSRCITRVSVPSHTKLGFFDPPRL